MSDKRYGLGVIGCGKIWEAGHREGLKEIPDRVEVRCIYDVDGDAARKAAEEVSARALDSADEVFEDDKVDIVAILTPPDARVEYVRKACAAGKHLMLEKPMARTLEQALDICREVRQTGAKCFIPFSRALNSLQRKLVELIGSGELGEPLGFVHTFLGMPYPWIPLDHWMHDQARSGGPVFDFSIHFLELARACMDAEAEEVLYFGANTTGRLRSDDHAALLVYYRGGGLGQFTRTWSFPPGSGIGVRANHVVCRDAVIVLDKEIEIHTPKGTRQLQVEKPAVGGRAEAYLNLIDAIENGAPLYADETNGLRMNEILDAMERSGDSGRREPVRLHDLS